MKKILAFLLIGLCLVAPSFGAMAGGGLSPSAASSTYLKKYAQTVWVGSGESIQAAINSVSSDAGANAVKCVMVNSGIYNQQVTMWPYVDLVGVDRDSCIINGGDATTMTLPDTSPVTISNLTLKHLTASAGRNSIANSGSFSATANIKNVAIIETTDYSHSGISVIGTTENIVLRNVTYNNTSAVNGALYSGQSSGITGATIEAYNCKVTNAVAGFYIGGNKGSFILKNNYVSASAPISQLTNGSGATLAINSYNNNFIGASTISASSGRTITWNSNGDTLTSVTKAGSGGTETFNSYGSVVGTQIANQIFSTTPEAYANTTAVAGSYGYVTSARAMYIRGFTTWEKVSSAP